MLPQPAPLPALVDTHCHLVYPGLVEDRAGVVARAAAAGLVGMVSISTRECEWADVLASAEESPLVWAAVGIHPHEADAHAHVDVRRLVDAARHPRVVGIGETGLDYHYDRSSRAQQRTGLATHIEAARETGLPLIVHSRDAEEDTIAIMEAEMARAPFTLLLHCFTGTARLARHMLDLGAYLSFSGIVTFKAADALRAVAAEVPEGRLLVETDAPFLAPVPHRGQTAEPAHVAHTARRLAELRGESLATLARHTTAAARRCFVRMG